MARVLSAWTIITQSGQKGEHRTRLIKAIYCNLSHALRNIQLIRGLGSRCVFCGISWVVFHPALPSLLASDYRNGAKNVCARYEMAPKFLINVVSFLHKIKICLWLMLLKKKMKNLILDFSLQFNFGPSLTDGQMEVLIKI